MQPNKVCFQKATNFINHKAAAAFADLPKYLTNDMEKSRCVLSVI